MHISHCSLLLFPLQMASGGVPLTARTLAHSHQNDLQRIANPRLEMNERRLRPIYDFMEIHKYDFISNQSREFLCFLLKLSKSINRNRTFIEKTIEFYRM